MVYKRLPIVRCVLGLLCLLLWSVSCGGSSRPLPRLDEYDFVGQTPDELAVLRQMATAEGPEGPLARYALARAHADWLVLALIRDRNDDLLLRRLAADLGIEGVSADDRLTIEQLHATIDAVLEEVRQGGAAGPEARRWAADTGRLIEGVRAGWEDFSPELFRSIAWVTGRGGDALPAADLLALGWGRVALAAVRDQPVQQRAVLLARMAAYYDPRVVEALAGNDGDLTNAGLPLACPEVGRARGVPVTEVLEMARTQCSGDHYGLGANDGRWISFELLVVTAVLQDLGQRRARIAQVSGDPLVAAAHDQLRRFDELYHALRFPVPLPAPGPEFATPPQVRTAPRWEPTGAVVTLRANAPHVSLWPVVRASSEGVRLIDRSLPQGEGETGLEEQLRRAWETSRSRIGMTERSVAVVVAADTPSGRLVELVDAATAAEASRVDLVTTTDGGGLFMIPLELARGAAHSRTVSDRRAVAVLAPDEVGIGDADGRWIDIEDSQNLIGAPGILAALATHLRGRGNAQCLVSAQPEIPVGRIVDFYQVLEPRDEEDPSWALWIDPEDPPNRRPVATTVNDALALHRVQLRECYEQFMREGGTAQGIVMMEIVVHIDGTVGNARVLRSELGPRPALDTCLVETVGRIRFPQDTTVRTLHVPLRFVPQDD